MKTITKVYNHRVVVFPINYSKGMFSIPQAWEENQLAQCRALQKDILRHVDGTGAVTLEWNAEVVCCHCKQTPEPDDIGRPACCDRALDDYCKEFGP